MAKRIVKSQLNASTVDILNTIHSNASLQYQSKVPVIADYKEIPKVGEAIFGSPGLPNEFLTSLINQIALVSIKSATFNNAYAELKKGYLEYGETIEEVFVQIAKAREFRTEKAEQRELKRTLPDVRTAFHTINWRVQYPVTIEDEELRLAFNSASGVQDLIAKIINAVYVGAEYDEFLLFKYLIIKGVAKGMFKPVTITTDLKETASVFRGTSNKLTFMSKEYNNAGVTTVTPKEDQYIFMDSDYNAKFDVEVLARAFNMDKADFMGKLKLIDNFTTFDNERFDAIREAGDMIEEVTAGELRLMEDVKAVLVDKEWFQVYDNYIKFTEKYVASGDYWNYFLNIKKTVSYSPFSNAVAFTETAAEDPATLTFKVDSVITTGDTEPTTIITLKADDTTAAMITGNSLQFVYDNTLVTAGVAVNTYGAFVVPNGVSSITPKAVLSSGSAYRGNAITIADVAVGATVTMTKG